MIPRIKVLSDRRYQLEEEHVVRWEHEGRQNLIRIFEGFVCDGNSVPWFGRPLIPGDWTLGLEPVLVHDFLYYRRGRLKLHEHMVETAPKIWVDALAIGDGFRRTWTRADADRLFARLMRDAGVSKLRRRAAYRAVRLAVWHNWDEFTYDPADDA